MNDKLKSVLTREEIILKWYQELSEVEQSHIKHLMEESFDAGKDDAMEGHCCAYNVIYP